MNLLTVVPAPHSGVGPMLTQGTRVLAADGTPIEGVTRIVLYCEVGSVWRAQIDCHVRPVPNIDAVGEINERREISAWRRWLLRLAGVRLDPTDLRSTSMQWKR